jgi:MoxR-like ATPase
VDRCEEARAAAVSEERLPRVAHAGPAGDGDLRGPPEEPYHSRLALHSDRIGRFEGYCLRSYANRDHFAQAGRWGEDIASRNVMAPITTDPQEPTRHGVPATMEMYLDPQVLKTCLKEINEWHQTTPLVLVFSRQKRGPTETVEGTTNAVRTALDSLFNLSHIGLSDDARKYFLHLCHGRRTDTPFAIRKETTNYGKAHQRTIKDTFGQSFLDRQGAGIYRLRANFPELAMQCLGLERKLDLRPLVLYRYWNSIDQSTKTKDLWHRFCLEYGVDKPPYDSVFSCSGLDDALALVPATSVSMQDIQRIVLPDEYGVGSFTTEFWKRFRQVLQEYLMKLRWQGNTADLTSQITASLMHDQALFLLGDPGTGKTTLVLEAILPALREAYGSNNEIRFCHYSLTPSTVAADLFGFQGLDGKWVAGPLVSDILVPYEDNSEEPSDLDAVAAVPIDAAEDVSTSELPQDADDGVTARDLSVPRLVFFDEANRVDIEALLSPAQAAFDRLQRRMEPPLISLGANQYALAHRVWRIYAGNSPISDSGRREQSRPFKRRCVLVVPPNPMDSALQREDSFRRLCIDLLEKAGRSPDPEIADPAIGLAGRFEDNSGRLEDLRNVLLAVRALKRVPLTVGLVESILLRAATLAAIEPEGVLDAALCLSLGGIVAGERASLDELIAVAESRECHHFARWLEQHVLDRQAGMTLDLDPIL